MDLFWCKENEKCKTKQNILLDIGTGVDKLSNENWLKNFSTFSTVPRRFKCEAEVCHPLQLLTHNPLPLRGTVIHDIHLNDMFVYITKKQGKTLILSKF